MREFATPLWFLFLIPLAVRMFIRFRDGRRAFAAFRFSSIGLLADRRSWKSRFGFLPFLLEAVGAVLLIIALARPQRVVPTSNDRMGIDIVVALDASGSMAAEDFRPKNRFEVARELVSRFLAGRVDDRIGIVTFGARAATRVPVTFDHEIARDVLDRVEIGENGDGTAIGHAIATSVNRLKNSTARSRVIILLTDGVNNAGSIDPAAAAALAARYGIKIYAVGVGSRGPVPIPVRIQSRLTGEIETVYQVIRADLDEPMLSGIARHTGGAYFRAVDKEALQDVLARVDRLEKTRLTAPKSRNIEELYFPLLVAGAMILLMSTLLGETLWMRLPA